MGDPGRFCEREEICSALCSLAVSKRMGTKPGPGSGRRPDYFLLSAGSSRTAQDGVRRVPSQAAQGHLCLCALGPGRGGFLQGSPHHPKEWLEWTPSLRGLPPGQTSRQDLTLPAPRTHTQCCPDCWERPWLWVQVPVLLVHVPWAGPCFFLTGPALHNSRK